MHENLKKKGWTDKEIKKHSAHLKKYHKKKRPTIRFLDEKIFALTLIFAIISSLAVSYILIFLFLILQPTLIYILSGVFGVIFGMLFEIVLRHIDWIEVKHHFVGGIIIGSVVILNLVIFSSSFTEKFLIFEFIEIPPYGRLNIGIIYSAFFLIPFIMHKMSSKKFY